MTVYLPSPSEVIDPASISSWMTSSNFPSGIQQTMLNAAAENCSNPATATRKCCAASERELATE